MMKMDTPKSINVQPTFLEGSILCPNYEKPLKKAFYNGVALLLITASSMFAWGSFKILEPFLKPLFWALLCGSVLHPLKYKLSSHFKTWIIWVENTDFRLPFFLEIVSCPIKLFLDLSEFVGETIYKHWMKICCGLFCMVISGLAFNYTPHIIICLSWKILKCSMTLLELTTDIFQNSTLVMTILLAFFIALTLCWDPKYEKQFLMASYSMWFALSAHTSSYFYFIKVPVFVFLQLLFFVGFLLSYKVSFTQPDDATKGKTTIAEKSQYAQGDHLQSDVNETSILSTPQNKHQQNTRSMESLLLQFGLYTGNSTSDLYIYWVSVACLVTLVLQSGWVPYFVLLLLIVHGIKVFCRLFGVTDFVYNKYTVFKHWLCEWYSVRKNVLIPAPILCLNTMFIEIRIRLLCYLRESSDSAASVMVILALVVFVIFGSTFLVIQAYTEGVYMIKVGGSVINQTVVHNPELTQLLPEGWEHKLDSVLNNAYTYGRQALSKLVRNMLSGLGEEKTVELETRALEVWDRVYQAWMMNAIEQKTTFGPKVTSSAVYQTWDHFLDAMHKTPELVSMSALTQLAQNNMSMLTSGLESVWELVRANASLVTSAFLTVLTVVFSHSFAVLNFCISMIVFLTALFYLLSSSRKLYKPVEVITAYSPVFGSRLAFAMENAVNEVLTASFKLALFYGMWTWLIHSLFQMNIVYIPSVLAAMLAVVPALGTYWACLPAVLDLWLAQGKNMHAITLAVCQFLPTLFVDATIYTEINEGHPYLTGLSVAGGLFCLGMEGAIIGPLILCCLYVVFSMSSSLMRDATTPTIVRPPPRFQP